MSTLPMLGETAVCSDSEGSRCRSMCGNAGFRMAEPKGAAREVLPGMPFFEAAADPVARSLAASTVPPRKAA